MSILNRWRATYEALPVHPARFQNWMTPLSLVAAVAAFVPALTLMLNIVEETPILLGLSILCFFTGLFIFAYDQKWATYNARRAGLTKNGWSYIKHKD